MTYVRYRLEAEGREAVEQDWGQGRQACHPGRCWRTSHLPRVRLNQALTNHKYDYRLRVWRYRIMFDVGETVKIISIQEVKKRDERTY